MSEADRIYDELSRTLSRWGLAAIPFSESASTLRGAQLRDVFTGRTSELREALALFHGRERKRLLVYGWVGIGKTAFILELLGVLRRKAKNTLTTYIQLPPAIDRSEGVPRWLNRLGSYVMLKAIESQAETITPKVLQQGLEYAEQQLRGQKGLTPEDYYVLDLVLEKGILSDETITLEDLERIKVKEFGEILPILEKLVQFDLVHRLPSERAAEYTSTPLLSKEPIKKS